MEKIKVKVTPCGYLHDHHAHSWYLLSPHPIPPDSWVTDGRQAWQAVVRDVVFHDDLQDFVYHPVGGQVTVICSTQSTVELCTVEPIEIDAYDWEKQESMTPEEIEEYERQTLRYDNVFQP